MHNSTQKSDEIIIRWNEFKQGDQKAFAALFELTTDRLYRYGIKFVNDEELVKDCIQELFIRLHQNRNKLPDVNSPIFYLFKQLKYILIDMLRKRDKIVYLSPDQLAFHTKIVWDQKIEEETDQSIKEKFEMIVSLLSDRQKEAIYLRYRTGLSYEEIAELLGINYQSTRNLIHRSIEKIRSQMDLKIFILLFLSTIE